MVIFTIKGRFTLGPMLHVLKPHILASLASRPSPGVILNFAGISDLDSAGLGELVSIQTALTQLGVPMALAHVAQNVKLMFSVTRLDGVLAVFDTERLALQHLAKSEVPNQP